MPLTGARGPAHRAGMILTSPPGVAPVEPALVLLAALLLDAAFADASGLFRRIGHPIQWIGALIARLERRVNRPERSQGDRRARGLLVAAGMSIAAVGVGWALQRLAWLVPAGWAIEIAVVFVMVAQRSLFDHVRAVASALDRGLAEGRAAVAHIVGRDPESLDRHGVARAAIESAAENFADGVVAPALWYLLFGLPGLLLYKTVNTLDSMIGHRSERYRAFGMASARLDDALSFVPSRVAGVLIVLAASLPPGGRMRAAWRTMLRDAPKHRSPNAGWPEAAAAGALGLALAGPRRYGTETVADPWIGEGTEQADAEDIRRMLRLYVASCLIQALAVAIVALAALE